jgi:hypothetical protein
LQAVGVDKTILDGGGRHSAKSLPMVANPCMDADFSTVLCARWHAASAHGTVRL